MIGEGAEQQQAGEAAEQQKKGHSNHQSRCSTPSSHSSSHSIAVETIADHVACGLCRGPVASSLLLSCSHLFCGSCLFTKLQDKACCPTCNMDLRAIPIRCLAMDKIAASIVPSLSTEEQQEYSRRKQKGQCVADQVNKMFHYLAPAPMLATAMHRPGAGIPSMPPVCMPAAGQADYNSSSNPMLHRSSFTGGPLTPTMQQHQQQYLNPLGLPFGSFPTVPTAAPNLLQLAAAQQLAHMQQLQQQLNTLHLNPAATAAGAAVNYQYPCRQMTPVGDGIGLGLMGRGQSPNSSVFGMGSQPVLTAAGYQDMQVPSAMMGGICQV